jgi:cystathionine beta-lyase
VCRDAGVTTALDNTWGAGLAFNGFDLGRGARFTPGSGADIVVQALTKYPSGGGDVLMGSIVTRDEALHLQLKLTHMRLGWGVGANDAEAVLRALAQHRAALPRAGRGGAHAGAWLRHAAQVAQLLHPALRRLARPRTLARPVHAGRAGRRRQPGGRACFRWCLTRATRRGRSTPFATR